MRLAVIHIGQETDTFNSRPTSLEDFEAFGVHTGEEIFRQLDGIGQVGGYLSAVGVTETRIESVPIVRGWAGAGGRLSNETASVFPQRNTVGFG